MSNFRRREAAERSAERRRREDEAPRLREVVPGLESLKLEIAERRGDAPITEASYVRRVVVEHAPAMFLVPCGDTSCRDGGHDITHAVMRGLSDRRTEFEGEDHCHGRTGNADCPRILRFVATAVYQAT